MPRFALLDEDEEDDPELYGDDDSESLDDSYKYLDDMGGHSRYFFDDCSSDDDENDNNDSNSLTLWKNQSPIGQSTQKALLSARINTDITPMKTLIKYAIQDANHEDRQQSSPDHHAAEESSVQGLQEAMEALSIFVSQVDTSGENKIPSPKPVELPAAYLQLGEVERRIRRDMEEEKRNYDKRHEETRRHIKAMLDKEQKRVERHAEKQRREQEAFSARREQERQRLMKLKRQDDERRDAAAQEEANKAAEAEKRRAEEKAVRDAERAARDYIYRAEKLVAQLKQLQESVEPFDKSKAMARRRLEMKKIVNGKVNTLSEEVGKILSVAADVSAAIGKAKEDDQSIQDQIKSGNTEYTPEMAKGKRYFVDLLCSKVIVRVQAEGFKGQRGDGFPIAHMLAHVAVEHKDIIPVLAAHVYTVCPTAIPRLPNIKKDATEEEVMESLGMLKGKDGQFETFERFLARTEGLVSIVSNIMSSKPEDHTLFGGHSGAIKWLSRFLSELPDPPISPLPLITAPVLDAFLTGAGHMLANIYPDEFRKCLENIEKNCIPRLDDGPVGTPSATRLKKTLHGGFESFKSILPSRALGELYHGSSSTGLRKTISSAPGSAPNNTNNGAPTQQQGGGSNTNPFGRGSNFATPSPFGMPSNNNNNNNPNPFGGPGEAPKPSPFAPRATPFGQSSSSGQQSGGPVVSDAMASEGGNDMNTSFGTNTMDSTKTSQSPFVSSTPGTTFGASSQTPFGAGNATFGAATGQTAPFGNSGTAITNTSASPFGAPAATPFGGGGSSGTPFGGGVAPNPSPFGNNNATPFGGSSNMPTSSSPSPFGTFGSQAPSPFGGGGGGGGSTFGVAGTPASNFGTPAQSATPFMTPQQQATPFGGTPQQQNIPFGGAPQQQSTPFGGAPQQQASPFGGAPQQQSTPFGGAPQQQATPFGGTSQQQSTPFGGTSQQQATPFGGASQQQSTPFGGAPNTPFGSTPATPFGGAGGGGGGMFGSPVPDNRPPCKFFARGQCRYGNSCKFSHETQTTMSGGASSFSNPFGGGPRR